MNYFYSKYLVFGAFEEDKVAQEAISFLETRNIPTTSLRLEDNRLFFSDSLISGKNLLLSQENYPCLISAKAQVIYTRDFCNPKYYPEKTRIILVVFFTMKKATIRRSLLCCAAHQISYSVKDKITKISHSVEDKITPLTIGCHPMALQKKEKLEEAVENIALSYLRWWENGFPTSINGVFPPWGGEPTGHRGGQKESSRLKNFKNWKESTEKYLNNSH